MKNITFNGERKHRDETIWLAVRTMPGWTDLCPAGGRIWVELFISFIIVSPTAISLRYTLIQAIPVFAGWSLHLSLKGKIRQAIFLIMFAINVKASGELLITIRLPLLTRTVILYLPSWYISLISKNYLSSFFLFN